MPTETLYPDAIITQTGLTGTVTTIDEAEDGTWLVGDNSTNTSVLRVSFPTPSGNPNTGAGLQTFRIYVRKTSSGGGDPSITAMQLRETGGGSALQSLTPSASTVTSTTGEAITATWDATNLGTANGSAVELYLELTSGGGGPNERTMDFDSVSWTVDYSLPGIAPSGIASAEAFGTAVITGGAVPVAPVIEAADITTSSGSDGSTASVTLPAYSSGDLVIVHIAYDGSSSTATTATPGTAPNSETVNRLVNLGTNPGDGSPDQWVDAAWWVATAGYAGGSYSYASDSTDGWVAAVIVVPSGEFDATTPISSQTALGGSSFGSSTSSVTGSMTLNADDGDSRLVAWFGVDLEQLTSSPSGWTNRASVFDGSDIRGYIDTRDSATTDSESVPTYSWPIGGDGDTSANVVYAVRGAADTGLSITATAISSAEAFGSHTAVPGSVGITGTGIVSAEVFGVQALVPGAVALTMTAIPTAETFGSHSLTVGAVALAPSGITTDEAFGSTSLVPGAVNLSPTAIGGAESFGTHSLESFFSINPSGISTAEAFGALAVSTNVTITLSGLPSEEAFGTTQVLSTDQFIVVSSIPTQETIGSSLVSPGTVTLSLTGITSLEGFGSASLGVGAVTVTPTSLVSGEVFGSLSLTPGTVAIVPSSIVTAETFGTHTFESFFAITPSGVPSEEAFGGSVLSTIVGLSPSGIASAEEFGTALQVSAGELFLTATGITSEEAFGSHVLTPGSVTLLVPSITSAESVGEPSLSTGVVVIAPSAVPSGEAVGSHTLEVEAIVQALFPNGIGSDEAIGNATLTTGTVIIVPVSISGAETFGVTDVSDGTDVGRIFDFIVGHNLVRFGE